MKHGFTLAEVLITLGIIGVVAALSAPSLVQDATSAQAGPKLAKAISTFETANEKLLQEACATKIANSGATDGKTSSKTDKQKNYIYNLSKYMKIEYLEEGQKTVKYASLIKNYTGGAIKNPGEPATELPNGQVNMDKRDFIGLKPTEAVKHSGITKDGMLFAIALDTTADKSDLQSANGSVGALGEVPTTEPDIVPAHQTQYGTVLIDINGKSKPNRMGKDVFLFYMMADGTLKPYGAGGAWNTGTDKCNSAKVTTGNSCAASILENDRKVIY